MRLRVREQERQNNRRGEADTDTRHKLQPQKATLDFVRDMPSLTSFWCPHSKSWFSWCGPRWCNSSVNAEL